MVELEWRGVRKVAVHDENRVTPEIITRTRIAVKRLPVAKDLKVFISMNFKF